MQRILVTGAAGFIGTNFVRRVLAVRPDWHVVAFDALTYAGNLRNLAGLAATRRFDFVRGDICSAAELGPVFETPVAGVFNFAAESHVDRSILGAAEFIRTNVLGTQVLLEQCRAAGVPRFVQVSTDEVYGSLGPEGAFTEDCPLAPNSPYSASKAAADLLVRAYHVTHGLPMVITRCSNNYGPYQFPEKVIPLFVTNLLEGRQVPLYGDGLNVRDWIHVWDHCDALLAVFERGTVGEVYNVGADNELTNLALTRSILAALDRDESHVKHVKDRPAHDRRYAIDATKIRSTLGWKPQIGWEQGLSETVRWYVENESWWREIKSGAYREYYARQYGELHAAPVEASVTGSGT